MRFLARAAAAAVLGLASVTPSPAWAQPPQRGDASGSLGLYTADKESLGGYQEWIQSLYGGVSLGWYWTGHLRTEMTLAGSRRDEVYGRPEPVWIGSTPSYIQVEHRFSSRRLSLVQQYQFGRNLWVHPSLGAGVALVWEREVRRQPARVLYDRGVPREILPEISSVPATTLRLMGVATAGLKAYFTRRAFFRTDLDVMFRSQIHEVVPRAGLGIDF